MVRCHLTALIDRQGLKIAEVARSTGLNRSTITALCRNSATRVELPVIDRLCRYFECGVADLFEYVPNDRVSDQESGGHVQRTEEDRKGL
jgi:putative transcriptional regulator